MDTNYGHRPRMMHRAGRIILWILFGIFITLFFGAAVGLLVQALWNWLLPSLFGIKTITYLQAIGITILGKLIFGSFGGAGSHNPFMKKAGRDWSETKEWEVKGGWGRWKYYNQYWKEEGKAAFEKYLEKHEAAHNRDADEKTAESK